jgi:hypothetical protein
VRCRRNDQVRAVISDCCISSNIRGQNPSGYRFRARCPEVPLDTALGDGERWRSREGKIGVKKDGRGSFDDEGLGGTSRPARRSRVMVYARAVMSMRKGDKVGSALGDRLMSGRTLICCALRYLQHQSLQITYDLTIIKPEPLSASLIALSRYSLPIQRINIIDRNTPHTSFPRSSVGIHNPHRPSHHHLHRFFPYEVPAFVVRV